MDISLQSYLLEIKKKIYFLISFLIIVIVLQGFYNSMRTDQYDVSIKLNFYDMNVLYSVIKMVNNNEIFASDTQSQNFIYQFETQIPKKMEMLSSISCQFKTNILTCKAIGVRFDPEKIDEMQDKLSDNVNYTLERLFYSEIKLIEDKIFSIQRLFGKLDQEEDFATESPKSFKKQQSTLVLGSGSQEDFIDDADSTKLTIKEKKIASIVKIEELEYLRDTLTSFADSENGIDYNISISKISLKKNTLLVFFSALAFGLIVIFLSIKPKNI